MKKIFAVKQKCKSCDGTGIYKGMGERDGFGVVCHTCKGTGSHVFRHEYEGFDKRQIRTDVIRVVKTNPGITLGVNNDLHYNSFGGISYEDWINGGDFKPGTEMRNYVCPAWWYQSADYYKKPNWDKCIRYGAFSGCRHFDNKHLCWDRFDEELD